MFRTYPVFVGLVSIQGDRGTRKGEKTDAEDNLSQLA